MPEMDDIADCEILIEQNAKVRLGRPLVSDLKLGVERSMTDAEFETYLIDRAGSEDNVVC